MSTVARYLASRLAGAAHRHVFLVTGGGAMFLNDALCHEPGLTPVYFHHEQAAAMAAEAYARIAEVPPILNVTTGPGGINALNGVFGAWTDSVPMIVISGQVKRATCLATTPVPGLRQLGDQEAEIIPMVRGITKYAAVVDRAEDIAWHLDQALHLAGAGRPGPVWLDIPIDVQAAAVDPSALRRWTPAAPAPVPSAADVLAVAEKLRGAARPVIIAGSGIRAARATAEFEQFVRRLGLPVTTAWTHDLIASDDTLFCGRPGTIGTRAGNFTVQNADLVLVLGSRLNIRQVSYNWQAFAPGAFKIQVDIDPAELQKPTVRPDLSVVADLKAFLPALTQELSDWQPSGGHQAWLQWCKARLARYPNVSPRQRAASGERINPYHFVEELFSCLHGDDIVACGNATATIVPFQVARIQAGMRLFSNSGAASMGYDLPAAIGAWFGAVAARGRQERVICLAGDGSIMMNLQELQTIAGKRIPVKIFVLNNRGYLSIRSSQENFFGRLTGEGPDSGVSFPDFVAVASAFGIPARRITSADFPRQLAEVLASDGPVLCDVMLDGAQGFEPRMTSRKLDDGTIVSPPLEDMFPFLERDELADNRWQADDTDGRT